MKINAKNQHFYPVMIALGLMLLTLAVYGQVNHFEFVDFDDQLYVTQNFKTQTGITPENVAEAFFDLQTTNWHPLTMMSHMLDWELFGENAGGHHWTNLIFHILNVVLLFLLLNRMTGAVWRSGLVAALFAVHPINVESVAWVAERKNVLSTFFWFLTMLFYVWYVRKPGWKRYFPVFVCFALGLMSKPMLVTLPFVLLLIDYWPLNRTAIEAGNDQGVSEQTPFNAAKAGWVRLILEKIPLFVLTAVSVVLTIYAAKSNSTIVHLNMLPFSDRLENAILSYALYLKKLIWPADLAVFYPLLDIPLHQTLTAGILLIVITVVSCKYYKKHPYLTVGWLWYLGTLIPVIGIIQVGSQSMADRYAYIPLIGIFLALSWFVADKIKKISLKKIIIVLVVILFLVLSVTSYNQVKYWKNSLTLFERALQVTKGNFIVHVVLGNELVKQGKVEDAIVHFHHAISGNANKPSDYVPLVSLANALSLQGKKEEGIMTFKRALTVNPKGKEAYFRLGYELFKDSRVDEAIIAYKNAIALDHENPLFHGSLGNAYLRKGETEDAIREYETVVRIQPNNVVAHNYLAYIYLNLGKTDEAMKHFQEIIRIAPQYADAHYRLSVILNEKGLKEKAHYHYNAAVRINPELEKRIK